MSKRGFELENNHDLSNLEIRHPPTNVHTRLRNSVDIQRRQRSSGQRDQEDFSASTTRNSPQASIRKPWPSLGKRMACPGGSLPSDKDLSASRFAGAATATKMWSTVY
ncbi:hypothetical protein OIDMADRAFT_25849 [Oidiodendron maius Zn]|uniref:Uncharacterized protein n=1 Tax=Oidiodendron maius (strain Zn) TaxID=913774 RepID=A0A0C3DT75_OIDMZ|nr:hypothetical protein OIDMADRAFT_25849 [Oidiodendron maius Zn]